MSTRPDPLPYILELEARQDEALRALVELDERIESALRDALAQVTGTPVSRDATPPGDSTETPLGPPSLDQAA
jgi:hypothetical protein